MKECKDNNLKDTNSKDSDLEKRIKRNEEHWSCERKSGYASGYNTAKRVYEQKIKKILDEKAKERIDLLHVYPYNLIPFIFPEEEIKDDENCPDISVRLLRKAMPEVLTEREARIIEMRYCWGYTLEQTGKEIGITRERTRQIEEIAFRRLRGARSAYECVSKNLLFEKEKKCADLEEENKKLWSMIANKAETRQNEKNAESYEKMSVLRDPIDALNLSVRSYNALAKSGIATIGDVYVMSVDELKQVRNLGTKSVAEIVSKLKGLGLVIKPFADADSASEERSLRG